MPEKQIKKYFSKYPFNNKKLPIFESDCKDENCELKGNFKDYILLNGDHIKNMLEKRYEICR